MIKRFFLLGVAIISALLLVSCATNFKGTKQAITQTQQDIQQSRNIANTEAQPVVQFPGYYVSTNPTSLNQLPSWAKRRISLTAEGMPFNLLVARVLRDTPAIISYQPKMNTAETVSMRYTGSIKGAMDKLAAKTNYAYNISNNNVSWASLITRTFNISFMPGVSNYMLGQNANASPGGFNASGSGDIVTVRGNLGNEQYSNLKGSSLSIWKDLRTSLDQLKSQDGKIWVSEATTTVTAYDHPSNIKAIAKYVKYLNKVMSEQVSIHVQVLELDLNKENAYGIDWNKLVATINNTRLAFGGSPGAASIIGGNIGAGGSGSVTTLEIGNTSGTRGSVILNALAEQGRLRIVTEPTVVTLNNQVAEVRITKDTGYLQSISTTSANLTSSQSTLTPGIVTDGFSLYLLPKIQGDKVYLQISSSLSTLQQLRKVSNAPTQSDIEGLVKPTDQGTQPSYEAIQIPVLQEKHFNQRTVLRTGTTLLISGFQQLRDEVRQSGLFGTKIPSGIGEQNRSVQTIVLITPTIIKDH